MAIAVDTYRLMTLAELNTLRAKVVAELNHQAKGGQAWSRQGSHQKTGVDFEKLSETLRALDYAIQLKSGGIVTETVADMSGSPS